MSEYLTKDAVKQMLGLTDKKVKVLFFTEGFPGFRLGDKAGLSVQISWTNGWRNRKVKK